MDDQELRKLLEQLQSQIGRAKSLDEKGRALLQRLDADIHELLERSGAPTDENILRRFQDAIDHFEVTHPALTTMLSQMLNILNNAGI